MRITFSTKPMYDIEEVNKMIIKYDTILGNIDIAKKRKEKEYFGSTDILRSTIEYAKETGLHHTRIGESKIKELEKILGELDEKNKVEG